MSTPPPRSAFAVFRSLYWRLAAVFLLLLAVLALIYVYVTAYTAEMYFEDATQRLNAMVAPSIAHKIRPIVNGAVDPAAVRRLFDDAMVINPSAEVYLLDTAGAIIAYAAPDSLIRRKSVSLAPVLSFIRGTATPPIAGDDPRSATGRKVFSAAPLEDDHVLRGYLYVILGGEEFDSVARFLLGSYALRLGLRTMWLTLAAAAVIGLIAFRWITRSLRDAISAVRRFQNGDHEARITASSGREVGALATAFNEMADTIAAQIEQIRTMDILRRDLVANVSHDLRTPLVSIHGYIETILMKEEDLSREDRDRYLRTVLRSTERLKKLVDELFELSRLEASDSRPAPEEFPIAELVQDVVQKQLILAERRGVKIATDVPRDLQFVYADIALMERVFQNLLDNAIKFTPAGGTVTIRLISAGTDVDVTVADTGEGIPRDELPHVFERFRRGRRPEEDQSAGAGLGLAIVKKILDKQGLSISVRSTPLEGTAFSFRLPSHRRDAPAVIAS